MKKSKKVIISVLVLLAAAGIYYYIALPPINLHSPGMWGFLIGAGIVITLVVSLSGMKTVRTGAAPQWEFSRSIFRTKRFKISAFITLGLLAVYLIGSLLSSPIVNASKYQKLIAPEQRDFVTDVKEISYNEIPLLDKDSAALLGTRKMGSMVEYVSQFEVSDNYSQINYKGAPYRVSPLEYGNLFKWFSNRSEGIPAYIRINMATQNVECVKLEEGIRYSDAEHFGRNIYRHLRFHYPTYMFENIHFEIDDEGVPYWICPVKTYSIGLFGGTKIKNVVLCNAITGELTDYPIDQVPTWIDRVYPANLLISYYDYYGSLKHGYLNTLFSAKDCLRTTEGYNYIALEDDVWVYTGITSVGSDQSNVGFVLMNQRTAETRYYEIPGAEEFSAMSSAEGQVQNLGYVATFPLLLNISDEPTYFISLKDEAGLVKKYAMVNIGKYNIVAIGDSVMECEKAYINLMKSNHIELNGSAQTGDSTITGTIQRMYQIVQEGSTRFYLVLANQEPIFQADPSALLDIVRYGEGDRITFSYNEGEEYNTILEIK